MISESDPLARQWRVVASALGIEAAYPPRLTVPGGGPFRFAVCLPQFGGGHGMLVAAEYSAAAFAEASAAGSRRRMRCDRHACRGIPPACRSPCVRGLPQGLGVVRQRPAARVVLMRTLRSHRREPGRGTAAVWDTGASFGGRSSGLHRVSADRALRRTGKGQWRRDHRSCAALAAEGEARAP